MKLNAAIKATKAKKQPGERKFQKKRGQRTSLSETTGQNVRVPLRLNDEICLEVNEAIEGMKATGDYSYLSLSDVVRDSLRAYMNQELELRDTAPKGGDSCRTVSFDPDLHDFYKSLPHRGKKDILERCIINFMKSPHFSS
jgi:hypothetical protein